MATVVLVHGGWHGAWCWDRVVTGLAAEGVPTVAVDLPGHGLDMGPFTDLHGDAARVRSVLDTVDGPVVLVGHSYGGAVITEAGTHRAVRHLVYVAGFALNDREGCTSAAADDPDIALLDSEGRPDLSAGFVPRPDGTVILDPSTAAACFFNDCDDQTTSWALHHLEPQPLLNLQQLPAEVAWADKPSTYAICAEDMGVHPGLERILARRCTRCVEWPTGHSPFLSRPDLVVGLLADRARALRDGLST